MTCHTLSRSLPGNQELPPGKRYFQLEAYRVLTNPLERFKAVTDERLVGLFRRIMGGGHDCLLCNATLNLKPKNPASPGTMGYVHGPIAEGVEAIAIAVCVACTIKLGDAGVADAVAQSFIDECLDGDGTVTTVQGGVA